MGESLPIKQAKFSNGEVSPFMHGDTTHLKYAASVKLAKNWIPLPAGALLRRPGTLDCGPTAFGVPRLFRFLFSDAQSFMIEAGNGYFRFYQKGKYIGNDGFAHTPTDGYAGGYLEVITPYTTPMLPFLKARQVGNTVTFTYGGQVNGFASTVPQDLVHTPFSTGGWTFGPTPVRIPINTTPVALTVNIAAYNPALSYNLGDMVASSNILWVAIQGNITGAGQAPPAAPAINANSDAISGNLWWMPAVDLDHKAVSVEWAATFVAQDPNGITYESGPSPVLGGTGPLSSDRHVPLAFGGLTAALPAGWKGLLLKLYRGPKGGVHGWVRDMPFSTASFVINDDGSAPDYTRQPPQFTDPFLVSSADSYPSVIGYLDQRRVWAGSVLAPDTLIFSKAANLYNYDNINSPGSPDDAFNAQLSSGVLEQIRDIVPLRRGITLTSQGEWAVSGLNGGPVQRGATDAKRQSTHGSSWLDALRVGNGLLFNTGKSNSVRDLFPLYGLYADIWDGQELSVLARHLFDLHTLTDWSYADVPYPIAWAARDDGLLLSLTYQHAPPSFGQQLSEGICGWAQHATVAGDSFLQVVAVPEPPDDAVYVVAKRLSGFRIERFSSLVPPASPAVAGAPDVRYAVYLDSASQFDGRNTTLHTMAVDSASTPGSVALADYEAGDQINVVCGGGAPFVNTDPGASAVVLDPDGLLFGAPVTAKIIGFTDTSHVLAELQSNLTAAQIALFRAGTVTWGLAKSVYAVPQLSGYALDSGSATGSRGVAVLADGDDVDPAELQFVAGVITLPVPAMVVAIGLAYNSDCELLDAYSPNAEIRNRFKNLLRVGFQIYNTRDLWVGKDFANLTEWDQRTVQDQYATLGLATGYFEQPVTGEDNKTGSCVFRNFLPFPATITSILREMDLAGV